MTKVLGWNQSRDFTEEEWETIKDLWIKLHVKLPELIRMSFAAKVEECELPDDDDFILENINGDECKFAEDYIGDGYIAFKTPNDRVELFALSKEPETGPIDYDQDPKGRHITLKVRYCFYYEVIMVLFTLIEAKIPGVLYSWDDDMDSMYPEVYNWMCQFAEEVKE